MDARITKKRIGQMLSYDWIKILACIVAGIFLWSLIFTTAASRLNPAQTFTVYAYCGTSPTSKFSSRVTSKSGTGLAKGFSYDVIETNVLDLASAGENAYTLLEARTSVQEGNVAFVSKAEKTGAKYKDEEGSEYTPTYLQDLLMRLYSGVSVLEESDGTGKEAFFAKTEAYLSRYYENIADGDTLRAETVESDFRARVKSQKDKRYKKEAQIEQGVKDETARIESYRDNYLAVKGYLEEGIIALEQTTVYLTYGNNQTKGYTGYFSINLCPDEQQMPGLKGLISYQDSDGNYTAKDMQLVLLDLIGEKYEYGIYESYAFIRRIVETCRKQAA